MIDSPLAFPSGAYGHPGMTLRDYFAAKAMQMHGDALSGIAAGGSAEWDELIARRAYETADAMLKARDE